jgi:hypothetical protein
MKREIEDANRRYLIMTFDFDFDPDTYDVDPTPEDKARFLEELRTHHTAQLDVYCYAAVAAVALLAMTKEEIDDSRVCETSENWDRENNCSAYFETEFLNGEVSTAYLKRKPNGTMEMVSDLYVGDEIVDTITRRELNRRKMEWEHKYKDNTYLTWVYYLTEYTDFWYWKDDVVDMIRYDGSSFFQVDDKDRIYSKYPTAAKALGKFCQHIYTDDDIINPVVRKVTPSLMKKLGIPKEYKGLWVIYEEGVKEEKVDGADGQKCFDDEGIIKAEDTEPPVDGEYAEKN